jgi:hypothetical protein
MKLILNSKRIVPLNVKRYFDELKNNIAWVVRVKIDKRLLYTLWFKQKDGDSKFLVWNEKVILFEKIEDLGYFLISNPASNITDGDFSKNIAAQKNFNTTKTRKERAELEFLCFSLEEVIILLDYKDWSKFNSKQVDFIINNLNMLTDYEEVRESDLLYFNEFMDYITFIVNSEIVKMNNFNKQKIRKNVKSLIKSFLKNSLMVVSVSTKNNN